MSLAASGRSVRPPGPRTSLAVLGLVAGLATLPLPAVAQRAAAPAKPVAAVAAPPVKRAAPEAVGLSTPRLTKLTKAFEKEVAEKRLPGVVMMVARKGKVAYGRAIGKRTPGGADAMRMDTIFRAYSMTKPFTSVGALILVEDGVLQLTDPVSKWLPAFKDMKVAAAQGEVAAERQMTVQDLLRHTSGLAYGELTANVAVKDALTKAGLFKPNVIEFDSRDMTAAEQVERLAKIPLIHQPGTTWEYSLATDLLGRVIEAASKQRLGEFLEARLFKPLKMVDTAFWLPPAKIGRLAEPFDKDPVGGGPIRLFDVSKQPGNDSGGAGTVTTAGDYLRFAQMLLNGGTLDGQRILSRTTVRLMSSDHLGKIQTAPNAGGGVLASTAYNFGLGFAVRPSDGVSPIAGSAGDYNWGGYAGTYFFVDPKEQMVAVMMVQSGGVMRTPHRFMFRQMIYQSVAD